MGAYGEFSLLVDRSQTKTYVCVLPSFGRAFVAGVGHDPTTSGLYPIGYNFPQFYKNYIRYDVI